VEGGKWSWKKHTDRIFGKIIFQAKYTKMKRMSTTDAMFDVTVWRRGGWHIRKNEYYGKKFRKANRKI